MSLPDRLGRLERRERIGAGGFATVWRYHDPDLESDVAVKVLADNWAQRLDVRERFLEEARILRRADSEHIVRVYDIGEIDHRPYFVMSYADLGSLSVLLHEGPQSPGTVLDVVRQAGAGLAVLHEQGVVHRDIKPHNLLRRSLGSAGVRIMVADLGVAKAILHASGLTQVVGTPAYMAPEQALGSGVDARADIHALAAVAYRLLTGQEVREGISAPEAAVLPPAPTTLAEVPAAVDDVLLRALSPWPQGRQTDVATFVREFAEAMPAPRAGTVIESPALTIHTSAPEAPQSRGRLVILWLLVFAVAFAAAYFGVTALRQ